MIKRCTLLLLVCMLLTGLLCPAQAGGINDQAMTYQAAQAELRRYLNGEPNSKSLEELCADFESLGRYQKSMSFLYYASLLRDTEAEDFSQAEVYVLLLQFDADFGELLAEAGFPSVAEVENYVRGRMAETVHDDKAAIGYYQQCGAMLDSLARMRTLLLATPTPSPAPTVTPSPSPTPTATPTLTKKPTPTPKPVVTSEPSVVMENVKVGDYKITTYSNGTCSITGYNGNANELAIPENLNGYSVTSIGDAAFFDCDSLTSITFPDSVTFIGDYVFCSCSSLTSVTIPDSVTSSGENPFRYCPKLTNIHVSPFHSTLTTIDGVLIDKVEKKLIFYPRDFKKSRYTIPSSVKSIGDFAFAGCTPLFSIIIPNSVTSIGDFAFALCSRLTSVTIPDSVISIGDAAFVDCPDLTLRVPRNSYAHQYAKDNKIKLTYAND